MTIDLGSFDRLEWRTDWKLTILPRIASRPQRF